MRGIGLITLVSVGAISAAPSPRARETGPILTAKSTAAFVDCFARSEHRRGAPGKFVPNEQGGTLSNLGTAGANTPYFITVSDAGTRREILVRGAAPNDPQAKAVEHCR